MKQRLLPLVALLILIAAGCSDTGQPLTPSSTPERLSKDKTRGTITVREGSVVDAITIFVDGARYDIANGATIEVPLNKKKAIVEIWECIWTVDHYECGLDSYNVEDGGHYAVVDIGSPYDLTLVSE